MSKVIAAAGKDFLVKYPVSSLIKAEAHLGRPLTDLKSTAMSFRDMSILVRYGLRTLDDNPISDAEFDRLLDSLNPLEFSELFIEVSKELSPPESEEDSGKN
jgi:hypothetical protein